MRSGIVTKFVLAVGIPLLVIYALITWAQYRSVRKMVQSDSSLQSRLAVEKVADVLDSRLVSIGTVSRSLAVFAALDEASVRTNQAALLTHILESIDLVDSVTILWEPSGSMPRSGWRAERTPQGIDSATLDAAAIERFAKRLSRKRDLDGGWSKPWRRKHDDTPLAAFELPLQRHGIRFGEVSIGIRLEKLRSEIEGELPARSRFAIVDDDWIVISSEDPADIGNPLIEQIGPTDKPAVERLQTIITTERAKGARSDSDHVLARYRDGEYWIAWAVLEESDWVLLDAVPEETMLAPVRALIKRDIVIGLGGLIVVTVAVVIMGVLLTRRIRRLDAAMQLVRAGDLTVRVDPGKRNNEITRLIVGFNQMVDAFDTNVHALASAEADQRSIERELDIARDIQKSLQPTAPPHLAAEGAVEIAAASRPAKHVAGDFYDYWSLDDHHLAFMLGDVSGKGAPAAIFMAVARTTIRFIASDQHDPAEILALANERLLQENKQGMFVTLFLGVYDTRTGSLRYANAGHLPAIRRRADGSVQAVAEATGTILGTLPDETWTTESMTLDPGDHFVLYTDGLSEAADAQGNMVAVSGVCEHIARNPADSAQAVCDLLIGVAEHVQAGQLFDDVTVMDLVRPQTH